MTREVFLDTDNLHDLGALFGIVGSRIDTLLVLCTKDVLSRSWCLGEMATARAHNLDVVIVSFAEFQWPSENFISDIELHVEGLESLVQYGIGLDIILATLRWLPGLPQIRLPQDMTLACVDTVVEFLVARKGGKCDAACVPGIVLETDRTANDTGDEVAVHTVQLLADARPPDGCQVVSIVDHSKSENVCTAHILKELLKAHCPLMTKVPHVLGADEHVADDVQCVVIVCSIGCFAPSPFCASGL